jgi:hypothetical protein
MAQVFYVYVTTNLVNGKQYIGDSVTNNIDKHWYYLGSGNLIKAAIKKYTRRNFKKIILETFNTKLEAFNAQSKYIIQYNTLTPNGYNISPKGGIGVNGCHSQDTKDKISKSEQGRFVSKITRELRSQSLKGLPSKMKGRKLKDVWIEKYGIEDGTQKYNEHIKQKQIQQKGKKHNIFEESRQKMVDAKKDKPLSQTHKDNLSKKLIGKKKPPRTEEHKRNIRLAKQKNKK